MRIGACRAFASTLVTAALIGLTACSGSSSSSASSSSENASVAVASAPATQSADCASADFGDACHLDELDFGQVPKDVFLAFFEASCLVDDGMDPAGTFDKATLECTRDGNKKTPVVIEWGVVNLPGERRSLLFEYYMDPTATDAAGCPTMTEWVAFAQPDVDVVNDPKAPTLSDECLTSVMAGLTQIYRAAASSQDP